MFVRSALYSIHGDDASHAAIVAKKRDITDDEKKHISYQGPGKKPANTIDPDKGMYIVIASWQCVLEGILITGCQSHETSADVTGLESIF